MAEACCDGYRLVVRPGEQGQRLDMYLVEHVRDISRSTLGNLIRAGHVLVNGQVRKAGYRVKSAEAVSVMIPPPVPSIITPEDVAFSVMHEDDDLVVLVKPPGVVVHPACGHDTGTLVHGLLYHCDNLSGISGAQRPGIVHRLDKDTSGLMVVAKNDQAHQGLISQFKNRQVKKIYRAIIRGRPATAQGRIDEPIGRHPVLRQKMAVIKQGGRSARTSWQVIAELVPPFTYIELQLETGRTHQIRVHMAHLGHPVAGDRLYGSPKNDNKVKIDRQCLHAHELSFVHPVSGESMSFKAPLWPDMAELLEQLKNV